MNLDALAKLAGVSVSTVSKAFSGSREVGAATRERIFALARENGMFDKYNKNRFGKPVVAVICPEWRSNFYKTILTMLKDELTARGALMTVSSTDFDAEREAEYFTYHAFYSKADGIILVSPQGNVENPTRVPAVAIGGPRDGRTLDVVRMDLRDALRAMVARLTALGHRRFGFAGERLTVGKRDAFLEALKEAGLPAGLAQVRESRDRRFEEAGAECAEAWLRDGDLPTAILAAYDDVAVGLIKQFRSHGVRVPEDVSVVGIDDIPEAPYVEPSLSSIRMHVDVACRRAVEIVTQKSKNQYYSPREEIVLTAEFIPRDSIGPVRAPESENFSVEER